MPAGLAEQVWEASSRLGLAGEQASKPRCPSGLEFQQSRYASKPGRPSDLAILLDLQACEAFRPPLPGGLPSLLAGRTYWPAGIAGLPGLLTHQNCRNDNFPSQRDFLACQH